MAGQCQTETGARGCASSAPPAEAQENSFLFIVGDAWPLIYDLYTTMVCLAREAGNNFSAGRAVFSRIGNGDFQGSCRVSVSRCL